MSSQSTIERGSPVTGHRRRRDRVLTRFAGVLVATGAMVATAFVVASPAGASVAAPTATISGWAATAPLSTARARHTATRLADGRVLVAGGVSSKAVLSSSEVYDPGTGTWQAAADLPVAVADAAAVTLPDGTVLVAGGAGTATELYNPATNVWTVGPPMPEPTYSTTFAATLPNGHIFVLGDIAAEYNPANRTWRALGAAPAMTRPSNNDTTMLASGDVVTLRAMEYSCCMPGAPMTGPSVYHWATDTWTTLPVPPVNPGDRNVTVAALPNGNVMLGGGVLNYLWFPQSAGTVMEVDPTTGSWTIDAGTLYSGDVLVSLPNGSILATGGSSTADVDHVYSPTARTWADVPGRNSDHATLTPLANGTVLAAGGYSDRNYDSSYVVLQNQAAIFTPTPTSTPPPATHHIGDLDNATAASSLRKWQPRVTATVLDATGRAVSGATVSATFTSHKGTLTCVTATNGTCTLGGFSLGRSTLSTVLRVTNVAKASSTYASIANSDPDGDSNGTTITVKRT
ncbi:kelch repeat-containing protein [Humibacillus sp. DSM 29435]|uniref:kelch repeat-containing protein n=1 Tax=Humibacillus sp. DSM 29435 TaxID=1869167 RepID=UPI0009F3A293|nr:kelch repeat-containing protein [Humibacillus sp. DSM 29435]